jgi:tripartite-type tricarboxylate transporter receptor subunit TctC
VGSWLALMAPRGTPQDVVRKINADVNRVLGDPEVVAQLATFGFEGAAESPEQLASEIRADAKKYAELVRRTGATAD